MKTELNSVNATTLTMTIWFPCKWMTEVEAVGCFRHSSRLPSNVLVNLHLDLCLCPIQLTELKFVKRQQKSNSLENIIMMNTFWGRLIILVTYHYVRFETNLFYIFLETPSDMHKPISKYDRLKLTDYIYGKSDAYHETLRIEYFKFNKWNIKKNDTYLQTEVIWKKCRD